MRKSIRKLGLFFLILVLILGLANSFYPLKTVASVVPRENDGLWNIYINKNKVAFTKDLGSPELVNNRTMVPLRVISEQMGYDVSWNQKLRKVTIVDAKVKVEMSIGESYAYVDGVKKPIDIQDGKAADTKAYIKNDRTMVPLRFISEVFGAEVGYNQVNGNHYITITIEGIVTPVYTGEIPFDKNKDVLADGSGRMSKEKTIEYLSKVIENSKMYTENGKHYFKYDKVEVPEGFRVGIGVSITQKAGSKVSGIFLSPNPFFNEDENTIPMGKSFVKELRNDALKNSDLILFSIAILKDGHKGSGNAAVVKYQINYNPVTGSGKNLIDISNGGSSAKSEPFDSDLVFKDLKIRR